MIKELFNICITNAKLLQLIVKLMDNLSLQITPLQVNCKSKTPLQLTCVIKKVAITTGHVLEKQQIRAYPHPSSSNQLFPEGPTFNLTKEFQAKNTKISLDFMSKRQRNISCIGSTEIDVAKLPAQSYSLLECSLNNSIYPNSKARVQVKREQTKPLHNRQRRSKPQQVGLLSTQGEQKQEWLRSRRKNPNVPTAYEISRRNFKKVEVVRNSSSKSNSHKAVSKGSYHKRYNQFKGNKNTHKKSPQDAPVPRRRTPQPILANPRGKNHSQKAQPPHYFSNGVYYENNKNENSQERSFERQQTFRQQHSGRYPQQSQKSQNQSRQSFSQNNYEDITAKLQQIQIQIDRCRKLQKAKTEIDSIKQQYTTGNQSFYNQSLNTFHKSHQQIGSGRQKMSEDVRQQLSFSRQQPITIQAQSSIQKNNNYPVSKFTVDSSQKTVITEVPSKKIEEKVQHIVLPSKQQKQQKYQEKSLDKQKSVDIESLIAEIKLLKNENRELRNKSQNLQKQLNCAQQTIIQQKRQLAISHSDSLQKDKSINILKRELKDIQTKNMQQGNLLSKMTQSYDQKLQEVIDLKEQISSIKKYSVSKSNISESPNITSNQRNNQKSQNQRKCLDLQQQLFLKKSALNQIVNTAWKLGNSQLMQTIQSYMQE